MKVTTYPVQLYITHPMRIALVSDLHDRDPQDTIDTLRELKPDLILVAGDLMERHEPGMSPYTVEIMDEYQGISRLRNRFHKITKLLDGSLLPADSHRVKWDEANGRRFIKEAGMVAPQVIGVGNHEWYYLPEDLACMEENRAILLDNADTELTVLGNTFRIGALSTRFDEQWLERYSKKDGVKILICHHPGYYLRMIKDTPRDTFDLIVSGHSHGGQWRMCSKGGTEPGRPVFSPGQGFFPEHAYGRFGRHIISAGVANTSAIPRWGNPCEIVLLNVVPVEETSVSSFL